MTCQDVRKALDAHADLELGPLESLAVEEHLRGCAGCRQRYRNLTLLKAAVAKAAPYYKAPAELRRNVIAAEERQRAAETPSPETRAVRPWSGLAIGAGMAACLMLGFFAAGGLQHGAARERLVGELTASHVRSLLASHLMDVASTDRHTVKPWFEGKLDFAPPVWDFADRGYPLAGGRLEYLDRRNVAALVYRRQKHVINLYLAPSEEPAQAPRATVQDGFNLVHWTRDGMTFWAVSDLNREELMHFAELCEAAAPAGNH